MLADPSLATVDGPLEAGTDQSNDFSSCTSETFDWRYRMLVPGTEPVATSLEALARTDLCKGAGTDLRVSFAKQG
ncbi:hypothetical protein SAMN04488239_111151 [Ruegeria marina]|uniref:Uncharacterized protein n=1 Tax=Ruegeria marina TaxID=639004 RepID=A0A1G6YHN3_9RHOB|nr:hypothetical protein SAMN04488239_111151 [Ruegeria marina]